MAKLTLRKSFARTLSITLLLFFLLINNFKTQCALNINKCCEAGMMFDSNLKCVDIPKEYTAKGFYWFPTNSIVDGATLKVQKSRRKFYLKLLEKADVKFGKIPECDNSEIDSISFTEEKPFFNFLIYNNSDLRVYVSSNKTLHRFESAYKFLVDEEPEVVMNKPSNSVIFNEVKLRTFPLTSVCVDVVLKTNRHRILICPCKSSVCIRKCCKDGEYFNVSAQNCIHFNEMPGEMKKWRPRDLENLTMRIHISKPGSLHDPIKEAIEFAVVQEESDWNENNSTHLSVGSLRTFPLEDTCVDLGFMNIHFLIYCPCRTVLCLRKCCKDDDFYNATSDECESVQNEPLKFNNWRPKMNDVADQYYLLSDTFPSCENPLLLKVPDHAYKSCNRFNKDSDNDFTIYSNGSVKVNKYKKPFEAHQYCGEVTWHENGKVYEQNLILCSGLKHGEQTKTWPIKSIIYGTLLIIGGVCLLITVAVSLYLPELRRRMHNKIALSHNVSLMVAYFTWGVGQLSPDLGGKSCMLIALIIQFTFLGSFFWLNIMCIDISMTFSATRSLGGHSSVGDYKKFLYYCIYSWGTTSIISVITMIMEFLPDIPYDFLKPGFACSCGFNTANASILIYFYGPMSILLIFNLVLFVFTTIKIMSVQRQTAILHKTDSNTTGGSSYQTDKQRYDLIQWLILYGKLFLLMGLTWITEIISWAVGGPDYYWYFSDILNLLRAVFIFILFVCKRPVLESLKRKLRRDSNREGCSKSLSDINSMSTSVRDSRVRSSTSSNKRKESAKGEFESQNLILNHRGVEVLPKNGNLESCM